MNDNVLKRNDGHQGAGVQTVAFPAGNVPLLKYTWHVASCVQ